MIAFMREGLL